MNETTESNADVNSTVTSGQAPAGDTEGAAFSRTIRLPRFWRIGLVATAGLILLISAALAFGASPSPSTGTNQTTSTDDGSVGDDDWLPGPGFVDPAGPLELTHGKGFNRGLGHGRFGAVTITAIDGSSLSLRTDDGWTRTITVTSSTTITRGGQAIALSDLKVGDTIGFRQTRKDDGSYSIHAIAVLVPRVAGEVTALTSNGFTLKARDGTTWAITVSGSTAYKLGSSDGSKADVKVGSEVIVSGDKGSSDTSLTALTVRVRVPVVFGQVTAKSGSTITIKRLDGTSQTLHVGSGTIYKVRGVENPSLSDIKVGMTIVAQGSQRSDGSIDATAIGAGVLGRGFKGMGPRFGFPHGQNPTSSASPGGESGQG